MAGLFDDLVPQGQPQSGGLFDDLVPQQPEEQPGLGTTVVNSLSRAGSALTSGYYGSGARLYHGLGNLLEGVNAAGDYLVDATGMGEKAGENGFGGTRDWLRGAEQTMQSKAAEAMPADPNVAEKVYAGVGAAPGDLARIMTLSRLPGGPATGFGADAAIQHADQGVEAAATEGAKGVLLGSILHATSPLATAERVGVNAAIPVAQGVAEGAPVSDIVANALVNGGMAAMPTGGTVTAREVLTGANRRPMPEPPALPPEQITAMGKEEPYIAPGTPDAQRVLAASGILPPENVPGRPTPRVADELAYEGAVGRVEARRAAEAGREQPLVTSADVAAREAEAARDAQAQRQAIEQAPKELTAEQLAEAHAAGEQPAPRPAPEVIPVQPPLTQAEVRNERAGPTQPEARQALAGEADVGTQAAMQRIRDEQAGVARAFDQAEIQQRRGEEYAGQRQAAEDAYAADRHYADLTRRVGEDPAGLVERQLGVPPEQFRAMPADARERVTAAAQRQMAAERPGPELATTDAALSDGEARYTSATRPQQAAGEAGRGRQPTDTELEVGNPDYARTATGTGDRPFRPDSTDGITPGQQRVFQDRAETQGAQARATSEEDLLRQWREREQARTSDGRGPDFEARNRYEGQKAQGSFTNRPGKPDTEGRYATDDFGFVRSDKGGPIRFADQKQAARWILNEGHKKSPDQIFEIANHPSGKGFTVRERGRAEPQGGADTGQGAERPTGGTSSPQEAATRALPGPASEPRPAEASGRATGDFGPIFDEHRGDWRAATERLSQERNGEVPGALSHKEVGEIDLVWGKEGTSASDGYGLAKIAKFHPEVLDDMQGHLDAMQVKSRSGNRVRLESDTHMAVVRLTYDGREKVWLLTEYARKDPTSAGRTTDIPGGRAGLDDTAPQATGRASENIAQEPPTDNPAGGMKLTSGIDPADVWKHLGKPTVDMVKREVAAVSKDVTNLRRVLRESTANVRPLAAASNTVNFIVSSNRGVMHLLRNRYERAGKPEAARLLSEVSDHLGTDPGSGRVVKQTYEEAASQNTHSLTNRMANMVGKDRLGNEALGMEVADILAGRERGGSPEARQAADRIRGLLNETHRYLQGAGVEVGYRPDYFPRALDGEKVRADQAGFLRDAEALYRKMGLPAAEAKQAANDWYDRELGVGVARFATQGPLSNMTKGRVLPPEADTLMAGWYQRNAFDVLPSYFRSASRLAEFTRRFGKGGEKLDAAYDAMLKAGVHPKDVALMRSAVDSSLGLLNGGGHTAMSSAVSWMQTIGILRALPRAVWSSLSEPMAVGVRSGNVLDGVKAFGNTWREVFGSKDLQAQRDVAEFAGTIGDAMTHMMIQGQYGGGVAGKLQNTILARFFSRSGLEGLTQAQRIAGLRIGQDYISRLLRDAEGGSRQASAKQLLGDLGIGDAHIAGLKRLLNGAGGAPKVSDLMGNSPEARTYTAALNRFVDESIQNPKAVDRPALANHPVGRLAYGIMSFMYTYTRNVTYRVAKQGARAVTPGNGLTMADRAALSIGPAIALMTLSAMQIGVARARDALTNSDESKTRPPALSLIQYVSRAGGFANLDPIVNTVLGAKYERDLTGIVAGPYLGQYLQDAQKLVGLLPEPIGKNSPNTNSAEWNAARAAYNMVAVPAIAAALSMAPGGPVLSKGYGALIASPLGGVAGPAGAPLSPQTASDFATAVAGERPRRWANQPGGLGTSVGRDSGREAGRAGGRAAGR